MSSQKCFGLTKPLLGLQLEKLYSHSHMGMKQWSQLRLELMSSLRRESYDQDENRLLQRREFDFLEESEVIHNYGLLYTSDALLDTSTPKLSLEDSK